MGESHGLPRRRLSLSICATGFARTTASATRRTRRSLTSENVCTARRARRIAAKRVESRLTQLNAPTITRTFRKNGSPDNVVRGVSDIGDDGAPA
jgi:hypothetical protein